MTSIDPPDLQPTRHSLLSRLKDWDNQDSWHEFFHTYWKLIYTAARKAGLDDSEAQDAVQDTILSVAKGMAEFTYDKSKGSFKGWLKVVTKRRVADILRARYRQHAACQVPLDATGVEQEVALKEDPAFAALDAAWESEWQTTVLTAATERVRRSCPPQQFQMFELLCMQNCPVSEIMQVLKVSRIAVHVAAHRVKKLIKAEVRRLETQVH